MRDPYVDCPVCHANTECVYTDRGDAWLEEVYVCEGDPSHEAVVTLGEPVVEEVRGADGDVLPESEWRDTP